jgi:transcriptional regulator with XRE-family HTH domain
VPPPDPQTLLRRQRLGAVVRRLREERGLTQEELAVRSGFDRKSVNRLENALYSLAVDRLYPLADALDVPVAALFEDEPSPTQRRTRTAR